MTNAKAWFNKALCPWKPEGLLGWTAQDGHLDSHTAPELCGYMSTFIHYTYIYMHMLFHVLVCRFCFVRVTVVYISVNISAKAKGTTTALSTCNK